MAIYAQRRFQSRLWLEALFSDGVLDPFVTRHVGVAWLPPEEAISAQDRLAAAAPNIVTVRTQVLLDQNVMTWPTHAEKYGLDDCQEADGDGRQLAGRVTWRTTGPGTPGSEEALRESREANEPRECHALRDLPRTGLSASSHV